MALAVVGNWHSSSTSSSTSLDDEEPEVVEGPLPNLGDEEPGVVEGPRPNLEDEEPEVVKEDADEETEVDEGGTQGCILAGGSSVAIR